MKLHRSQTAFARRRRGAAALPFHPVINNTGSPLRIDNRQDIAGKANERRLAKEMPDREKIKEIREGYEKWTDDLKPKLEKRPERRPEFVNMSGVPIKRLYTPMDTDDIDYMEEIGFPGQYPYTRGVQPTMYRGRFWTMRQYAGFGSAEETNQRYHYLLQAGQTGLSVAFDLPTQIGYDSDHELAQGEVGKVGVAIDSLWDMETLFQGIPLRRQ